MTGRSIFFGRVCSLRLFPLFLFSIEVAAQNNGSTFSLSRRPLARKIFLSVAKKAAQPARINSAQWWAVEASTVMEGGIAGKTIPGEFIGLCFVTQDATPWLRLMFSNYTGVF